MVSELIIDFQPKKVFIAVLEDKKLVEFYKESRNVTFSVGSIYLGKVKKLMPGLNAAFIDIGYVKEAFLHYRDLGNGIYNLINFLKLISEKGELLPIYHFSDFKKLEKEGSITDVLRQGDSILVQVVKEPISTKGIRITSELSLAGRYLILIPFSDKVKVSSKIQCAKERLRLKLLVEQIKPKNFSIIIRTSAKGKEIGEFIRELRELLKCWDTNICKLLKSKAPSLIYEETGKVVSLLRDSFNSSFANIYINDEIAYRNVQKYISLIDSKKVNIVKYYKNSLPILDKFDITKQLKAGFGKIVKLKNGPYLIIERTEAMYVIDVNSGNCSSLTVNQESMTMDVNLKAALEIAKQLRLRDIGGIIVIDFIDMYEVSNRQKLYEGMCTFMSKDRAKHHVYPLSKIGVMEITRKRVRSVLDFELKECCSFVGSENDLKYSIFFTDFLSKQIEYVVMILKIKKFCLYVHPYVASFIEQSILGIFSKQGILGIFSKQGVLGIFSKRGILGIFSLKIQWKFRYSTGLQIIPDQSVDILGYHFFDTKSKVPIEVDEKLRKKYVSFL